MTDPIVLPSKSLRFVGFFLSEIHKKQEVKKGVFCIFMWSIYFLTKLDALVSCKIMFMKIADTLL
jgi:hypothetical protein